MAFDTETRLKTHFMKAHPSKKEYYEQKWYWENK